MAQRAGNATRSVVITGASTGIGAASALALDRAGWRVFAGVRRVEDGAALRQQASERLTPIELDVADGAAIAAAAVTVGAALGDAGLDGLVNNAGISVAAPLEFVPVAELRRQLEVNVTGQVAVTQALLPLIRRARGRIVNMGSMSGVLAPPFLGPYAASKFAMEALTDCLRVELRPWGIAVVIIEPGGIATPIWEKSLAAADRLLEGMPQLLFDYYGPVIKGMRRMVQRTGETGLPVRLVAEAVTNALTVRRPKTRYRIAKGGWLTRHVIAQLPDRTRDGLIAKRLPTYP
ncbi:MAG TPA: SDR family oxidoreductase [Ktedonobacterales bacterium]|jgi:NAD(P)-dependent dehydrogenase (short-subunit alcohol dehydrogenase family)